MRMWFVVRGDQVGLLCLRGTRETVHIVTEIIRKTNIHHFGYCRNVTGRYLQYRLM